MWGVKSGMGGDVWKGGAHKERRVWEKSGDDGCGECGCNPGPGQGKWGRGVGGAEGRGELSWVCGEATQGTGTQSE